LVLAERSACRRLVFSDTNEAARLLSQTYRAKRPVAVARAPTTRLSAKGVERRLGDALFLVSQRRNAVLGLSATAAAIWQQLVLGRSRQVIATLFLSAFPDIETGRIEADIDQAFQTFERHGLVGKTGRAIAKALR
jgi:hypothetical protein